jgi:HK97 family phage portal protein
MVRVRAAVDAFRRDTLQPVTSGLAALTRALSDWFSGAWQQATDPPDEEDLRTALGVAVVYDCVRRIATDIAKMSPGVRKLSDAGVWVRATHQVFSRLIYRPNHFQTWFQFIVSWVCSRLLAGNAYVLKLYKGPNIAELIVLDPTKVIPLVAWDTGKVFYHVGIEYIAGVREDMTVASEDIIHDRYMPLGHPLIGTSPLERAMVAARARHGIISNAADLNEHASVPPGILTAPEGMTEEQLDELANKWRQIPKGRIAVMDASFKFEALAAKYVDSQSQEIGDLAGTDICIAFGMPPWKLGLGTRPVGTPEANQLIYLQDCLQWQIEEIEQCLDHGLDIPADVYVELDPACLLKMDSKTKAEVATILVKGIAKPDELRAWFDMEPVPGGDAVYLQQQNYSLAALDARDKLGPAPAGTGSPSPSADHTEQDQPKTPGEADQAATAQLPPVPWSGVYDAAREYPKSSLVTHRRGLWLAQTDIPAGARPGAGTLKEATGWRLIAGHGAPIPGVVEES